MALAKQETFLPAMKGCHEEDGRPPPFHIASLLSPSPPQIADREKGSSDGSATVHYLPAAGNSDANAPSISAELPAGYVYAGKGRCGLGAFFRAYFAPLQDTAV